MICGIYGIFNKINNKFYVGQSVNIKQRWSTHRQALRHHKHYNRHLQNSWDKYGEEQFVFKVIEECSRDNLQAQEDYWIHKLNANDANYGYNLVDAKKMPQSRYKVQEIPAGLGVFNYAHEWMKENYDLYYSKNAMYEHSLLDTSV